MVHIHDYEMITYDYLGSFWSHGGIPSRHRCSKSLEREEDRASRAEELAETLEGHGGNAKRAGRVCFNFCYLHSFSDESLTSIWSKDLPWYMGMGQNLLVSILMGWMMNIHLPAVLWFTRYQGYDS